MINEQYIKHIHFLFVLLDKISTYLKLPEIC